MEPLSFAGLFAAGLLTFASPCVLPLIPLYLSFLSGASVADLRAGRNGRGLVGIGIAFSLGLSSVFVALGVAAGAMGASLEAHRDKWIPLAGVALVLFGLKLMGLLKIPFLDRDVRPALSKVRQGTGLLSAFGLGAAFALGWTPCVGPVLGAALSFAATSSADPLSSALYLAVFAAGLSFPLVLVAAFSAGAFRWMDKIKPHLGKLEKLTGAAVATVGVLMITGLLLGTTVVDDSAVAASEVSAAATVAAVDPAPAPADGEAVEACGVSTEACALPEVASDPVSTAVAPVTPWVHEGAQVLAFESGHCPVCERMKPVVASAEKGCSDTGAPFRRVDVGTSSGLSHARSRGVFGVPTYVFLDRGGKEVSRLIGEQSVERVRESVEAAAGKPCS